MKQYQKHTMIEAVSHAVIGLVMAIAIVAVAIPVMGLNMTVTGNISLSLIIMIANMAKAYGLRRFFTSMKKGRPKTGISYLAGPYSHEEKKVRKERAVMLTRVSAALFEKGIINFSPITQSHEQHKFLSKEVSTGFEDWRANDLAFVSICDEILVAEIPGFEKSYGVAEEIKYAKENGIPVRYIELDVVNKKKLVIHLHDDE